MSGSSDEDYLSYDEAPPADPKRVNYDLCESPFSSLEVGYKANRFDRPLPVKEDLIVYVDSGRTKIGYVSKVGYRDNKLTEESDCRAGTFFHVDEIPSLKLAYVAGYEAITIDRCYSVGETVMAFKNKHEGTDQEKSRCHATSMIGQIIAVRTTADVVVLPEKKFILQNVPIEKNYKMLELMNYNSSHNYVLYKDWIGDIVEMENEIVCWYYKQRVTLLESSKQESYFRRKGENRRSNKSFIPGETVYVELRYLTCRAAKWEKGEVPAALRRKRVVTHSGQQKVRLVIEKVVPSSVGVKWLQSPSSIGTPDPKIGKDELKNLVLLDVSANPRISSADRMLFTFDNEVRQLTKKEYNQWMADEFKPWFVSPRTSHKKQPETESSQLKAVAEEEEEMRSEQADDEEEDMEVDEKATGDNAEQDADEEKEEEMEPEKPEPPVPAVRATNRLKRGRKGLRTREPRKKKEKAPLAPAAQPETKKREGTWVKGVFCAEVLLSRTVCDVEWMDGTISKDVPGATLVPIDPDLDQQDHLPGNTVAKKSDDEVGHDTRFGIIMRVNPEERVATVRWFRLLDITKVNGGAEFTEDEEVTLFDIMPHPYFKRQFPGYLGVSVTKAGAVATPDLQKTCCKIMKNLDNGKQLVEYMDHSTEELWPMDIIVLPLHEHDDDLSDDGMDDTEGWQTMDDSQLSTAATAGTAASVASTSAAVSAVSVSGASTSSNGTSAVEAENSGEIPSTSRVSRASNRCKRKKKHEGEEDEDFFPLSLPMFEKGTLTMLDGEAPKGHKYLNEPVTNPAGKWMRAVMREHAQLKEHLPKEIHLWAWENRLDLLTCIIFGPSGTPFELTPFHFDIHIPETFPAVPPKVHYYAWSQEQLNPNLYQQGKVCVSLLGTWDGDGAEKWTPTSNLLQVFISIQGLILNAEPYFNEAGYEERKNVPEHEANSKRYNETATINSLEYLWRIYDRPPEHLAAVIRQGVDSRIAEFKKRVEEWAEGKKQPEFPVHSSKGFRLALKTSISKVASIVSKHQHPATPQ